MSNRGSNAPFGGSDEREKEEKRRKRRLRVLWGNFNKARKRVCGDISKGESLRSEIANAVKALRDIAALDGFEDIVGEQAATSLRDGLADLNDFLQDSGEILGRLNQACDIMERLDFEVGPNVPEPGPLERLMGLSAVQKTIAISIVVGATAAIVAVASSAGGDDGPGRTATSTPRIDPTATPSTPGIDPTATPTTPAPTATPIPPIRPPRLPDLAVSISNDFNIECDRTLAITCTLTVNTLVENVGDADLPGPAIVVVELSNAVQFSTNLEKLAPGQTIVIPAKFQNNFQSCFAPSCSPVAEIDPPGRLSEHNKLNNNARTTLFLPDLRVANVRELPDNTISGVTVRVINDGEGPTRAETDLSVTIDRGTSALGMIGPLGPQQTQDINLVTGKSGDCPESGCTYVISVDAFDKIFESIEANNRGQLAGRARIR